MTTEARYERYVRYCRTVDIEPMPFEKWLRIANRQAPGFSDGPAPYESRQMETE